MTSTRLTLAPSRAASPIQDRLPIARTGQRVVLYSSSDCWRGAGISFVAIARGLEAAGFLPHVVATCDEVISEFEQAGVLVTPMRDVGRESAQLRRVLREAGAAAVLVDRAHDLRVGTLAVLGTGVRLLHRFNHFGKAAPSDALTRIAYRTALSGQVFLSWSARSRVLEKTAFMRRVPATTIHEGIDPGFFRPSMRSAVEFRRNRRLGDEPFILAVGALSPEKRYPFLFDALRLMGPEAPLLIICGEGRDDEALRSRAAALGLRVRFEGRIAQSALVGAYNACTALVHPGAVETFGLAVLEAMACARPVIASAGGALPEVIGSGNRCGTLIPSTSAWDFAGAIRRTLANADERAAMGSRARERARRNFSVGAMERGYAAFVSRHLDLPARAWANE